MKTLWSKDAIGNPPNLAKLPPDVNVVDNPIGNVGNVTADLSNLKIIIVAVATLES